MIGRGRVIDDERYTASRLNHRGGWGRGDEMASDLGCTSGE